MIHVTFRRWIQAPARCVAIGLFFVAPINALAAEPQDSKPLEFVGFDLASLSDDAKAGLEHIFAGHLFHDGVPIEDAKQMMAKMAAASGAQYDLTSPEGRFYAFGRCPSPPDRTAGGGPDVALGTSELVRDGQHLTTYNCLGCHAGVVNGQVVAGLANNHVNQSDPKTLRTRGDNYGPYGVWKLGALLADPANEGLALAEGETELLRLFESADLAPVDGQPWWLMKYKQKDYWYADAAPHDAASFAINFTVPHEKANEYRAEHVKIVAKALAYARETNSPIYPGELNAELVKKGSDLFHGRVKPIVTTGFRTCKNCHGSYEKYSTHTDLRKPGFWTVDYNYSHVIRNVKTDMAYSVVLRQFKPIADRFNELKEYYANKGTPELVGTASVPNKPGYVAPPLVGIWASAPYFHNGSVPTIKFVLNSKLRPEIWERTNKDPHAYDLDNVGMSYRSVTREEFEKSAAAADGKLFLAEAAVDHSAIYDTKQHGHGNMGHTFGDSLTDDERSAIIEFLKSLSGPDMQPMQRDGESSAELTSVVR